MPYNLIDEQWIPVRCRSGDRRWIAPWQMMNEADPPLRPDSGRPDFDGALLQFLIGLMQTTAVPADNKEWRSMVSAPLPEDELRRKFESVRAAFHLDGEGPRFMQDLTLGDSEGEEAEIASLLIDSPGEFDHFVKRDRVSALSRQAVATALFTLQTNAPSGGRGHRTGLRGGGPLTTILSGATLWETVALNLLTEVDVREFLPGGFSGDRSPFPWMRPTTTSERNQTLTPDGTPAMELYWAMPRRIRVNFDAQDQACSLYPSQTAAARSIRAKAYGNNYGEGFLHPLTPYTTQKGASLIPRKGRASAFQYRDWVSITLGTVEARPARVILNSLRLRGLGARRLELFGYDMDNMKPVAFRWSRTLLPGDLEEGQRVQLADEAQRRTAAAGYVLAQLRSKLRQAWEGEHPAGRGEMATCDEEFWSATEGAFFESIGAAIAALGDESLLNHRREEWLRVIHGVAMEIFDRLSGLAGTPTDVLLRQIALARRDLVRFTHPNGDRVRKECGLAARPRKG